LPIKPVDRGSFLAIDDIDKQILYGEALRVNPIGPLQRPAICRNRLIRWPFSLRGAGAKAAVLRAQASRRKLAKAAVRAAGRALSPGAAARKTKLPSQKTPLII
jgi:hypothetical protein